MIKNIALRIEESVNNLDSLNGEIRFTREEQLYLCEHFEPVELCKNEYLLRQGETEKYFYFVEQGILRYWTPDGEDREITVHFAMEGEFAGSYRSMKKGEPSRFHIQAIGKAVVWRMERKHLAGIYSFSLNFNRAVRVFFEDLHSRQANREICLKLPAEERYRYLLQQEKEILLSVPLKLISSYLGITPQTLSRIRRTC
ncbi:MAG: Crp/Fnr family transcriptional regulator [Tannerellaceae bacterium]|jgi:CRP-like cAMP-binding protein|nr:Crp/Fnr family transcriptional regulator [Tannerellaceae bacterium]